MSLTAILIAVGGLLATIIGAFLKGRSSGKQAERNKQRDDELAARDIADQVDNDVGALPPDARRKELGEWSK